MYENYKPSLPHQNFLFPTFIFINKKWKKIPKTINLNIQIQIIDTNV